MEKPPPHYAEIGVNTSVAAEESMSRLKNNETQSYEDFNEYLTQVLAN